MSRPIEEIPLLDVNPDDEYIEDAYIDEYDSTVGDTTGVVGGESKTPARRGSIEWEKKRETQTFPVRVKILSKILTNGSIC